MQNSLLVKKNGNLFVLSGAGKSEKITNLTKIRGGYELIADKVYSSTHRYNTKTKLRFLFFKKDKNTYVCIKEGIADYGKALEEKGVEREGKTYDPLNFELSIDIYKQVDKNSFQYVVLDLVDAQSKSSKLLPINKAQKIGSWITFGATDKALEKLVEIEVRKIWKKRKAHFQRLLLLEKNKETN